MAGMNESLNVEQFVATLGLIYLFIYLYSPCDEFAYSQCSLMAAFHYLVPKPLIHIPILVVL